MQSFTGIEYLKIDIASNFGLDKSSWIQRIQWADQNHEQFEELIPQADTPALYFAGVEAFRDTQENLNSGYMISLDATSSGIQILSCLTGDIQAAQLCNVVDVGFRQDAYQALYKEMQKRNPKIANISASDVKQSCMTAFYGSKAMPRKIFGEGDMLETFYATLMDNAPGAWQLNEFLLSAWNPNAYEYSWVLPDNFHVHSKVMDHEVYEITFLGQKHEVHQKINKPTEVGRSLGANMTHSLDGLIVREITRRCDYNPQIVASVQKMIQLAATIPPGTMTQTEDDNMVERLSMLYRASGYLSARILEHLRFDNIGHLGSQGIQELTLLLNSMPKKPFNVLSIHDCFRCHPNYGNDLRQQYNIQLALIARSSMLDFLLPQMIGIPTKIQKLDPMLHHKILMTEYALS